MGSECSPGCVKSSGSLDCGACVSTHAGVSGREICNKTAVGKRLSPEN